MKRSIQVAASGAIVSLAIVLWTGTAFAQTTPIDVGDTVGPSISAIIEGIFDAVADVLPVIIPAVLAMGVLAGVIRWLRRGSRLTGA